MHSPLHRGFTLVEMAVVLTLLGLLLAFSVPAFHSASQGYQLKGATQNIAGQLRLAREKAIATGTDQVMHFTLNFPAGSTWDYHIHNGGFVGPGWSLPNGIDYANVTISPTMLRDGRMSGSGIVVLRDRKGNLDTVSVLTSGLVLTK